jgi:hypothetical protein
LARRGRGAPKNPAPAILDFPTSSPKDQLGKSTFGGDVELVLAAWRSNESDRALREMLRAVIKAASPEHWKQTPTAHCRGPRRAAGLYHRAHVVPLGGGASDGSTVILSEVYSTPARCAWAVLSLTRVAAIGQKRPVPHVYLSFCLRSPLSEGQ